MLKLEKLFNSNKILQIMSEIKEFDIKKIQLKDIPQVLAKVIE